MAEYIEREKALKAFDNPVWRAWSKGVPINRIINKIPAADVEPVRHGRWIAVDGGQHKCSYCHTVRKVDAARDHFCPNCGAKMDEEGRQWSSSGLMSAG